MSVQSDVDVCNLAQDMLGAEALASIDAPRTANEKRYARQYPVVRDAELRKRRWNFAKRLFVLTPTGAPLATDQDILYRYNWPGEAVRAVRESGTDWVVSGRQVLSTTNGQLKVWFIIRTEAAEMDDLFVVMLAAALASALCEAVTQSNEKKADAKSTYETARREAGAVNAFEIGPEKISADDAAFSWVSERYA